MTVPHMNDVTLLGRLSGEPGARTLPSGDVLVAWRLVVERPPGGRGRVTVDTIACVSFEAGVREPAAGWRHGDVIEVRGSLRRRFWRTKAGAGVDRCEVLVREAQLIAVATPETAAESGPAESEPAESGLAESGLAETASA